MKRFSGFTFLELAMVVVIIAFLAAVSFGQIQSLLRLGRLANEREWVKAGVLAAENYYADIGQYPSSLSDLTSASPPYLKDEIGAKCGTLFREGSVQMFNSCNVDTLKYHYLFQFTQWDRSTGAKIPPKVVEYTELTTKVPYNSAACGTIPAGTKFFAEMVNGKITASSCGQENEIYNERY